MKTITIQILAEDIKNSNYDKPSDCAMTRAFKRAGLPFHEGGGDIYHNDFAGPIMITPKELADKVKGMYKSLKPDEWRGPSEPQSIPPEDFIFKLEIPDEYAN